MTKGAKTIAQFKILEWINKNFERESVEVVFDEKDRATVTDQVGDCMYVTYSPDEGIKWEVLSERMEELEWAWNDCSKWDDDEYQDWYESLTEEEKNQIDAWDKGYSQGMLRLCREILKRDSGNPL